MLTKNKEIKNNIEIMMRSTKKSFDSETLKSLIQIQPLEQIPVKYVTKLTEKLLQCEPYIDKISLYDGLAVMQQIITKTMTYINVGLCRYDQICELNIDRKNIKLIKKEYNQAKENMLTKNKLSYVREYTTLAKILFYADKNNVMYKNLVLNDFVRPEINSQIIKLLNVNLRLGGHIDAHLLNILEASIADTKYADIYLPMVEKMRIQLALSIVELQKMYCTIVHNIVNFANQHEKK